MEFLLLLGFYKKKQQFERDVLYIKQIAAVINDLAMTELSNKRSLRGGKSRRGNLLFQVFIRYK